MRKVIVLVVAIVALALAAPAFPLAIQNPHTGACRTVLAPGDFPSQAFDHSLGAWNGVFNSNDNAAIVGVFC